MYVQYCNGRQAIAYPHSGELAPKITQTRTILTLLWERSVFVADFCHLGLKSHLVSGYIIINFF